MLHGGIDTFFSDKQEPGYLQQKQFIFPCEPNNCCVLTTT